MPRLVTEFALLLLHVLLVLLVLHAKAVPVHQVGDCEISARLPGGVLCGVRGVADNQTHFASFLGVPYAKQPLGELRFKELQPLESWDDVYYATEEGPICPQHDVLYGELNKGTMNEGCIYANIHVPLDALPGNRIKRPVRGLQPPYETGFDGEAESPGRPVLVFIHGGGFAYGSGGTGLHGPEYLMHKDVIVITFNYRLNVFGFLSLNSSSVSGNNGLRDMVTLLHWVQDNVRSFGGDPNDVTIAGQSAGATSCHLLTLSKAAEGLFSRAILMSGTALPSFYTPSPIYAQFVANLFLSTVGINSTDPEDIHRKLIELPIETIMEANRQIQNQFGLTAFLPVVESIFPGVTTIIDNDPEVLMSKGCGNHIPLIIGFTNAECETFKPNFEDIDILTRIKENPQLMLSLNSIYNLPPKIALKAAKRVEERYFSGEPTLEEYIHACSDTYYIYPAIKVAMNRATTEGAPVYLYEFSYEADFSVIKETKNLKFKGAGHIEDMTFLFRANALEGSRGFTSLSHNDLQMVDWMTMFVKNFIQCNDPTCDSGLSSSWPSVGDETELQYQNIERPMFFRFTQLTKDQKEMVRFFDNLQNKTQLLNIT